MASHLQLRICMLLPVLFLGTALQAQPLESRWQDPPPDSRPWNYWYWMYTERILIDYCFFFLSLSNHNN